MAAGLTDHTRTLQQLLTYRVPPPPWVSPQTPQPTAQTGRAAPRPLGGHMITILWMATNRHDREVFEEFVDLSGTDGSTRRTVRFALQERRTGDAKSRVCQLFRRAVFSGRPDLPGRHRFE
jgi:hypothetical protein